MARSTRSGLQRLPGTLLLAVAIASTAVLGVARAQDLPPAFPVKDFFSNPERAYFRLSEDGRTLGFMQPVVAPDGKSTLWRILAYSAALIPVSILPVVTGMAGRVYLVGAVFLGAALLRFSYGMVLPQLPATAPASKPHARRLLQATIVYLPLLFALMMANSRS